MNMPGYSCKPRTSRRLVQAWIALCAAVALHVADEAMTGFLSVYNPTVLGLRERGFLLPLPVFTFHGWLIGLIAGVALMFLATFLLGRGTLAMRWIAYLLSSIMIGNGIFHIVATILGHTIRSVRFSRPAPGFYSSPILLAASIYLLVQLTKTRGSLQGGAWDGSAMAG